MSFPSRIKYGINYSGNPKKKCWIPASAGMTLLGTNFRLSTLVLSLGKEGTFRLRPLLMHKVCVHLRAVFHEIIDADLPVLGGETLAKDLGFEFQPVRKLHLGAFQNGFLKK